MCVRNKIYADFRSPIPQGAGHDLRQRVGSMQNPVSDSVEETTGYRKRGTLFLSRTDILGIPILSRPRLIKRRNRLFMTASQSLYAVYVEAVGAHFC